MKVPLSGKLGEGKCFQVSEIDHERTLKHTWWLDRLGRPQTDIKHKRVLITRFIMNPPDNKVVDHISGNQLDNRRENLRVCTRKQNQQNRTKNNRNNSSGFRGVSWDRFRNKWVAQLSLDYKHIYLGRFDDIEDAKETVKRAILERHGEFANVNNL